jgi:putative ABC transport system permease protein
MLSDLRSAFRQLTKSFGFTLVAVLTLAIGIGACTSVFSIVNSVILQPLPYPQPDRLTMMYETVPPSGVNLTNPSPSTYLAWQSQSTTHVSIAAADHRSYNVTNQGEPFRVYADTPTVNFFSTLGVQPMLGRAFLPEESTEGKNHVVILSYHLWQNRFAGNPDIIGKSVLLDEVPFIVIGVMPERFNFYPQDDLYTPLVFSASSHSDAKHSLLVIGRLKPGVSLEQASVELGLISDHLAKELPDTHKGYGARITTMIEAYTNGVKTMSYLLMGAVCCLLLIACTNIANLLLARASTRQKEIAVRTALGASRPRIVRQLLCENFLLALLGGGLGLALGKWSLDLIVASLATHFMPRASEITLDGTVLLFTCVITLLTGLIFGLVPALQASRVDLNTALKDSGGRGTSAGGSTHRLRNMLVVSEIALALVLLAGAGLFFRSLLKLQNNELGYNEANAYLNVLLLSDKKYPTPQLRTAAIDGFMERIARVPGIASPAFTNHTAPTSGAPMKPFRIAGQPPVDPSLQPSAFYYGVTPGYFKTLQIPLRRGRFFTHRDTATSPRVALINDEFVRKYFPAKDPIGQQVAIIDGGALVEREIIGVVGNVRQSSPFVPMLPQFYEPYAQTPELSTTLLVRTTGAPLDIRAVAAAIHATDPGLPLDTMYPMANGMSASLGAYRVAIVLFGVFSSVALLLAALGIYGVMAYNVAQRTGEIGIRMALGAQNHDVLRLILKQAAVVVSLGLIIGVAGSLVLARVLGSMLYDTSPYDPLTFASIILTLTLVALFACWLPARRATKVDPMIALRAE